MANLTTVYTKEKDGGYTAYVVELPGCVSYGETIKEAEIMIKEAVIGYLEAQKKLGNDVKSMLDTKTFISSMPLSYETI